MPEGFPAEMVGATTDITLAAAPTTTSIPVSEPVGPAAQLTVAAGAHQRRRVFLNLENITSPGVPGHYAVYINLPPNADPKDHRQRMAGLLPTFGVKEASRANEQHAGSGIHHAIDVTRIVEALQQAGEWDPKQVRVTFVPLDRKQSPPVKVGRASVYYK